MKKMFSKIFSKVSFAALSVGCASVLFGCASTKLALGALSPMAVLNVEGSSVIWEEADDFDYEAQEDEGGGILATSVNKLLNSKNPELQTAADRMNYALSRKNAAFRFLKKKSSPKAMFTSMKS